ncbi:MAG: hypothetical protein GQ535_13915 [Rhodobacteraceae bacterium]|nr:hypothetical protein [Paracoccaceae bacterium]
MFKKLGRSKILPWVGAIPIFGFPLYAVWDGEVAKGIGAFIFWSSFIVGIGIGRMLGKLLNLHLVKETSEFEARLKNGFSAFGFLFLPALAALWVNAQFGLSIGVGPMWGHLLWASVCFTIVFISTPENNK